MAGALVTGAGRGLGLEIARVLVRRGHVVCVTDVDGDAAAAAAEQLGEAALASALDVRDPDACRAAARQVAERAGSLDVWVNNAGVLFPGLPWEHDDEVLRTTLDVNALGTMHGTRAALEVMRPAGRGHIVNIVSLAGLVAAPGEVVYSASKHAAIAFSLGTLFDLRRSGEKHIHISCVCPDGIWTPMLQETVHDPHTVASYTGRLLRPEEVAEQVGKLLDRPRPVRSIPRSRGLQVRLFDLWPRLMLAVIGPLERIGRLKQARVARRGGR